MIMRIRTVIPALPIARCHAPWRAVVCERASSSAHLLGTRAVFAGSFPSELSQAKQQYDRTVRPTVQQVAWSCL